MDFWIIQIGEPMPTESQRSERLMRSGLLAASLGERGHKVTWWATTFDHVRKEYRYKKQSTFKWRRGVTIRYLHSSTPYKKNISLSRIINHYEIARDFRNTIKSLPLPDLILCGLPTTELCVEAVKFGSSAGIPTYLDIRDLWPDDIVRLAPKSLHWAARLILNPIQKQVNEACSKATGICATSQIFVNWGLRHAGRAKTEKDADFPLGYSDQEPAEEDLQNARAFWSNYGICKGSKDFLICFFGALGTTSLLKPAIDAVKRLNNKGRNIKLVICGKGDRYNEYQQYANDIENILLPGWVCRAKIWELMRNADVGLVPVRNIYSYMSNYPNKTIEYMSAGLPLLSCLKGILGDLIESEQIGVIYDEEDVNDLCCKIENLMNNRTELQEMAVNAKILFKKRFASEKVYSAFSKHLEINAKK